MKVGSFPIPEPVCAHGQWYVALTWGRYHENLKVLVKNTDHQGDLLKNSILFTRNTVINTLLKKFWTK